MTGLLGRGAVRSLASTLDSLELELERGRADHLHPVQTGFSSLDTVLGGGLRPGGLTVIGGGPGVGKTVMALQWARRIARAGRDVVFVCYEHDESDLLIRLLMQELSAVPASAVEDVREGLNLVSDGGTSLREILEDSEADPAALDAFGEYAERLHLVRASGAFTGLEEIAGYLQQVKDRNPVLFVDYLQKVLVEPTPPTEEDKVTIVAEALKDLALDRQIPVVAIVAVDMEGLAEGRLRMHHFRGSSALVFEADVALVLNDKRSAVAKVHLTYDPVRAETFKDWVVLSVEKNRGGPSPLDLEFEKDFVHFRFDPHGRICRERLVDSRLDVG